MLSTTEVRPLPAGSPTTTSKEYFTTNTANESFTTVGSESEEGGAVMSSTRQIIDPGLTTRFDVKPGETYSQTFTIRLTIIQNGIPFPTTLSEVTIVTTYVGRQEITVPAGRFNTCRFELSISSIIQGQEFVSTDWLWFAVDDGVLVRQWNGTEDREVTYEEELESGTLNGRTL
jgi:hypothetical protein